MDLSIESWMVNWKNIRILRVTGRILESREDQKRLSKSIRDICESNTPFAIIDLTNCQGMNDLGKKALIGYTLQARSRKTVFVFAGAINQIYELLKHTHPNSFFRSVDAAMSAFAPPREVLFR